MGGARTAILFSGGVVHPFESAAPALAEILRAAGFEVRCSFDLPETLGWLRQDSGALLVVYALRWSMTQHEKYAPDRPRWALSLAIQDRALIASHVARGGGLLGVHTASICFDDWPQWGAILGGAWEWGRSHHPPLGAVHAHFDPTHPLTRGIGDLSLRDEVYSNLRLEPNIRVIGWATAAATPAESQPACWTHQYGEGRVVYDSLGHDAASLQLDAHRRLLQRAALWANRAAPPTWEHI